MKKKDIQYHLKKRWEEVHKIEVEELKKTSLKDKLLQILAMSDLGKYLKLPIKKTDSSVQMIIARWQRLKNYYSHETK
ncbi:hypothetical protein AUJ66_03910 [Candidatus Desantisbacteria bacterium CG1_02_38_46]|uniref:Uncharacterized protein n=3 Tax=unclassified Candidatus Desantisiibacteriota TaxID=3106372 RepID=A0A2H9PAT8_9BACT|nr:MAG: hypothetical protein AUJ66_03910 [Candidatus Desantisbacteria bacterium CG1_02_38_46]PIU51457.1 MAG: hypothetical protein COS91_04370 [Candidatus Desantisbacteria bacterium CG07_land_8_20_14_0_80_39_15]PIZ15656.1 MAG: hypothetical protein COY51_04685 [Candidatus Desantisbacteria bacterium CG_4_10_14_0_8_um_filter_39_17]